MKNLKNWQSTFFLILLLALLSLSAYGQVTPSADAYTNTASPTMNFGTKPVLDVESASQTTYIQFDLSSIPAGYTSANVAKASLKLYVNAVTTAGSFNVNFVNGAWSEKTITANLAPAMGATIAGSVPLTASNVHDFIIIDVTSAVGAWLDGSQANDGIALVANSPLNASFDSKENTTNSQTAELDVVFAGTGTGAITGVTTASGSGLTGGGTKGTLALSLTNACAANQTLQWNGSAWVCSAAGAGTITGVTAGTDLTGGGTGGNVTLNLNTTSTDTRYAQLAAANTFSKEQQILGTVIGLSANTTDPAGIGVQGFGSGAGVEGMSTAAKGIGVLGYGYGVNGVGVAGTSNKQNGVGVSGTGIGANTIGVQGVTGGGTAIYGQDSQGGIGVEGTSTSGYGVYGFSVSSIGIDGYSSHGTAVSGVTVGDTLNTAGAYGRAGNGTTFQGIAGVWGDADQHVGVFGSSNAYAGVIGESQNGYGVQAISNGADGVNAISHTIKGSGVAGINDASGGIGVYGSSTNGGFGFYTDSNVAQARGMGGWVKAMVFVDPFTSSGTAITRCYNSQASGATVWTPPCGISITHEQQGEDLLDFGFQVNDRYVSTTVFAGTGMRACVLDPNNQCLENGFFPPTANQLLTDTFSGSVLVDVAFYVIVF